MPFDLRPVRGLKLNPILLGGATGIALFKETDPAREKPRGDESKEPGGEEAPRDAERDAFAEPALDEKLRDIDEIKMQRGKE